jgi:signal peptide peptidase SppA
MEAFLVSDKSRRYSQVTKAVYERPWAIQPAMLAVIEELVSLRAAGTPLTDDQIHERIAAVENGPRRGAARAQGVAVIPIYGVIAPKANLFSEMSGATTVEGLTRSFREAQADPDIGAIIFDVDSPGGSVEGITELANEIQAARGGKPIVAVANHTMASAAYWIASAADEIVASPSAMLGSIGIIAMHLDVSAQDEMVGEKYTFITAGDGKADGNEHEPLTDETRADIQSDIDDFYDLFTGDVAQARGVPVAKITGEWKADMFTAKRAVVAGLADRVDTLDATVRRMVVEANRSGPAAVHALASAGLTASEQVAVLLSTMPIHEQLALVNAEGERVAAHYAKRAELRAKEGRALPQHTEAQLAALESLRTIQGDVDPDLDTDQPEEAVTPKAADWRGIAHLDVLEAAVRGGYQLPQREVSS